MQWLETAMDEGIPEREFWDMSIAELERSIASRRRVRKAQERERASYDYILADLIGKSVGRLHSSQNKYPAIEEAYPGLFDAEAMEEQRAAKRAELSAIRFRQFADQFNRRFKGGANDERGT